MTSESGRDVPASDARSGDRDVARRRRRAVNAVKEGLRELRVSLVTLNHRVGTEAELRDVDLDCFDLVAQHGPLSPSALAKLAGLHPATMTGVLDRLEAGGWLERSRDVSDRRSVALRATPRRSAELIRLFSGMSDAMNEVCASYDESQLELIVGFLDRAAQAGRASAEKLVP